MIRQPFLYGRFAPTPVVLPIFVIAPKQTFGAKS